jgi:hypothetical protein
MKKRKSTGAKYFGKPLTDDPDDAPELLEAFFRDGELRDGARLLRRGRPPISGRPKPAGIFVNGLPELHVSLTERAIRTSFHLSKSIGAAVAIRSNILGGWL